MSRLYLTGTLFRAVTILFILCLFVVGSFPAAGHAFPGAKHQFAHLTAYALISFCLGKGWQKLHAVQIVLIVASIGFIHELTEIVTHSHAFETNDAIINALGAVIGVLIYRGTT
jgi:glycopeptide antibiotics resistance protein